LSYLQVQEEVLAFCHGKQSQQQTAPSAPPIVPNSQFIPTQQITQVSPLTPPQGISSALSDEEVKQRIQQQIKSAGNAPAATLDSHKVREYVDQLFLNYVGRKGDPASTNFLVNSITDKSYSFMQAEVFVKFSKEAKAYAKQREKNKGQEKINQVKEYVQQLFRVYLKNPNPTPEEIKTYVDSILDGSQTLQDIEDEIRLLSLAPPKK